MPRRQRRARAHRGAHVPVLGKRPSILQEENEAGTAILESHPYRHYPALSRILRYAALELELLPSANLFRLVTPEGQDELTNLRDVTARSLYYEPDWLVDNKGHRGSGAQA
jgi:hypothetical protein